MRRPTPIKLYIWISFYYGQWNIQDYLLSTNAYRQQELKCATRYLVAIFALGSKQKLPAPAFLGRSLMFSQCLLDVAQFIGLQPSRIGPQTGIDPSTRYNTCRDAFSKQLLHKQITTFGNHLRESNPRSISRSRM